MRPHFYLFPLVRLLFPPRIHQPGPASCEQGDHVLHEPVEDLGLGTGGQLNHAILPVAGQREVGWAT